MLLPLYMVTLTARVVTSTMTIHFPSICPCDSSRKDVQIYPPPPFPLGQEICIPAPLRPWPWRQGRKKAAYRRTPRDAQQLKTIKAERRDFLRREIRVFFASWGCQAQPMIYGRPCC